MLVEAVERGSLSAAARALRVPLPTLSRKVADLEAHVGAQLLIRTTRRLALTDAGAGYVAAARRILEQVQEAEREAAGELVEPKGELVVSAPVLFGRTYVLPVVAGFLASYPDIDVRLLLSDRNAQLIDDQVDVAVRIGALPDSDMIATRLGAMRVVTCASPGLIARYGVPVRPTDLADLRVIALATPSPVPGWLYPAATASAAGDPPRRTRLTVTKAEAAVDAARRDVGLVRLLYYQVAEAVADGSLRVVLDDYEPEPAPIHAIHVARGRMPLKLRRFLDDAVPRLRRDLQALANAPHWT